MRTISIICLAVSALGSSCSHLISTKVRPQTQIEQGYISITIERGEKPYKIGSASFDTASEAARFLAYLDQKWPGGSRPNIVVEYLDKAVPEGDEAFEAALVRLESNPQWKVIRMPSPRGSIPESWTTLEKLKKEWAEKDGAGQPPSRPESK